MQIYDYILAWFNSPAGMFLDAGSTLHILARACGPLILLLAWLYADRLRAQSSGWAALAAAYPPPPPEAEVRMFSFATAYLGGVKYWNTLSVGATRDGLRLRTSWLLLRPFHAPLMLPWKDIQDGGKVGYGGGEYQKLIVHPSMKIPLLVDEKAYSFLAESYGSASKS